MTESIPLGWAYLPVAFALGGLHILEPGHGKALASAYLVSGKHTWKDAVVLGLSTTASHTALVILLAAASLWAQDRYPAAQIEQNVRLFGAWALILIGAYTAWRSLRDLRHGHAHAHHGHSHAPASGPAGSSLWAVALIGFSNGITPCPGALAALSVALSLGQVALGLITVLTYSAGMALALSLIALLMIEAGERAQRWLPSDRATLWLPLLSGVLVSLTGLWLLAAPAGEPGAGSSLNGPASAAPRPTPVPPEGDTRIWRVADTTGAEAKAVFDAIQTAARAADMEALGRLCSRELWTEQLHFQAPGRTTPLSPEQLNALKGVFTQEVLKALADESFDRIFPRQHDRPVVIVANGTIGLIPDDGQLLIGWVSPRAVQLYWNARENERRRQEARSVHP